MDTNAITDYLRLKHEDQQRKLEYEQKKEFVSCNCDNAIKNIEKWIDLSVYEKFKTDVSYALACGQETLLTSIKFGEYKYDELTAKTVQNFPKDSNKISALDLHKHCPTYGQEYCNGLAKEFKDRGFNILSAEYDKMNYVNGHYRDIVRFSCLFNVKLD